MKRIIIAALVTLCSLAGFTLDQGSCKDSRDGKVYATVKIGSQTWMAQNLEYRTKTGTRAWGDDMGNVKKYGYLYDWAAAREACPKGWRLPSDADWKMLELHLGMAPDEFEKNRKRAEGLGLKLKSATGWYENGNGNNGSGFNALPGAPASSTTIHTTSSASWPISGLPPRKGTRTPMPACSGMMKPTRSGPSSRRATACRCGA